MAYDRRTLTGIGGWLAFFILTLAVFGPLSSGIAVLGNLYGTPGLAGFYGPRWPAVQALEWLVLVLSVGSSEYLAWRLICVQTPATVRLVRAGIWVVAFGPFAIEVPGVALLSGQTIGAVAGASVRDLVRPLIYCVIWTAYLIRSERVANTYTEDEPDGHLAAVFE